MRTNIVIDDELMHEAPLITGNQTKRATVEAGLRALIRAWRATGLRALRGKALREGDLEDIRTDVAATKTW
ncbi:MAG: type II toxin-antitoxin system VapB family antitoxin [Bifidobacteriaceae bacterium]|nr:type II toxin-antitoxin system VapB family antitoxin [Bifidobacteriaceae bacterium]